MPSAPPFSDLGKKKLMLAMLELKLAPPKPHSRARIIMWVKLVSGFCTAMPRPMAGISRLAVLSVVHRRPPKIGTMKE